MKKSFQDLKDKIEWEGGVANSIDYFTAKSIEEGYEVPEGFVDHWRKVEQSLCDLELMLN